MNKIFLPVKCSEMYWAAKKNPTEGCELFLQTTDLIYPIDAVMQSPVLCKLREWHVSGGRATGGTQHLSRPW